MEPDALLHLLSVAQAHRCRVIVECGSGVSTIAIGKLLRQSQTGHLYSLEENESWHATMSGILNSEGLSDYVTLLYAPLERYPEPVAPWYKLERASQILESARHIDLLLIDGPKSVTTFSRFPALPVFAPGLDEASLIVLDDSKRPNEMAVIKRWRETFNLIIEEPGPSLRGQAYIRLLARS
jgi:predicted O-methyltransferase YrrM